MKTIWKYELTLLKEKHLIPKGGIIRHIDEQFNSICVWIEVDTTKEIEERYFAVYGTGHEIQHEVENNYIGSVKLEGGALVFHIYEYKKDN